MPVNSALTRKLDILSRSSSTPKILTDVLYLLAAEVGQHQEERLALSQRVADVEFSTRDPSHDVQRGLTQLRTRFDELQREAQQLEASIREAEASFSAQYELKRAQLEETLLEISSEGERLTRVDIPQAVATQLRQVTTALKEVSDVAVSVVSSSLHKLKTETIEEVDAATKHLCTTAVDQLQEECQVAVFSATKRIESDLSEARKKLDRALSDAVVAVHSRTQQCSDFVANQLATVLEFTPLEEIHRLQTEVQYCHAQIMFIADSTPKFSDISDLSMRVSSLTKENLRWNQEQVEWARFQKDTVHDLTRIRGFVSLWDAEDDVLEGMADVSASSSGGSTARIAHLKVQYLHSLPAFQPLLVSSNDPGKMRASSSTVHLHTPPPVAKAMLLNEASAQKTGGKSRPVTLTTSERQLENRVDRRLGGEHERVVPPSTLEPREATAVDLMQLSDIANLSASSRAGVTLASTSWLAQPNAGDSSSLDNTKHSFMPQPLDAEPQEVIFSSSSSSMENENESRLIIHDASFETYQTHPPQQPLGIAVVDGDPLSGGVIITEVIRHSPAEKLGLVVEDQLISVNGVMVSNREQLSGLLRNNNNNSKPNELRLHVYRPSTSKMFLVRV